MVAAIMNANRKGADPDAVATARNGFSIECVARHLLKDHPVLSCVVGNSGNMADVRCTSRTRAAAPS